MSRLRWSFLMEVIATLSISPFRRIHCFQATTIVRRSRIRSVDTSRGAASDEDVSFTIPKVFSGEVADGSYPSPLHSIHVRNLLSDEEAGTCLSLARDYAKQTGRWDQPDLDRHSAYATCDFPIEESEELASYLHDINFNSRVWDDLNHLFGVDHEDMTYLDFFCVNYQSKGTGTTTNSNAMDRLEAHRDGSLLSFTVLLSPPSEFQGGGTFFDALRDEVSSEESQILRPNGAICPTRAGDACYHSGKLLHGADVVTSGKRTVLVGFVDVADWCQRPGVLSAACRDFGRMDVAAFRHKWQQKRTSGGKGNGWVLNNSRWLPRNSDEGRSYCVGYVPPFRSVERRADPAFQRLRKLEAEDVLLRTILLTDKAEQQRDLFGGDATVL